MHRFLSHATLCNVRTNRFHLPLVVCFTALCITNLAVAQSLDVEQSDDAITIKQDDKVVLTYVKESPPAPDGIDAVYQRSGCLHPVSSPRGRIVTEMFPPDHAHQHGIFSAWVNTTYDGQPVDFWNLAGRTGRVLHEKVVSTFEDNKAAGFEIDLIHRAEKTGVDVLRERWRVAVHPTDGSFHMFDLETTQAALTDKPLIVNKYHYGGIALRGPTRWLTARDGYARQHPDLEREASGFLNNVGSDREKGNHEHAKWVALWGTTVNEPVSIAVLCHAENFRAPQAARLHPTKPYFCYSPCVDETFTIDRSHPFKAKYRFLVTDARPDPAWIDSQWAAWCAR